MTKAKPPKTKKYTLPKLKEIYGRKAPDYSRRPKKTRGEILQQMRDDAEATGLDKKLDVTPDDVVALQNTPKKPSAAESKPLDPKHPNRAPWREVVAEAWGKPEERSARKPTKKPKRAEAEREAERILLERDIRRALEDLDAGRVVPWETVKRELERIFSEERSPASNVSLVRTALQDIDALPAMVLVALATRSRLEALERLEKFPTPDAVPGGAKFHEEAKRDLARAEAEIRIGIVAWRELTWGGR